MDLSKHRPHCILTGVLILFLPFSGCIAPEPEWPPVGLGFDVPSVLPRPGHFLEPEEDLQVLETFLREEGPRILEACNYVDGVGRVDWHLNQKNYGAAIEELFYQCSTPVVETRIGYAERAIRENREEEVLYKLHEQAVDVLEILKEKINDHPGPGNTVDAALLNRIMGVYYTGYSAVTRGAFELWEPYEDGTSRELFQLTSVYMNFLNSIGRAPAMMMVLDRYPWTEPPCTPPDIESLSKQIKDKINQTLVLAYSWGESTENEVWNNHFGRLVVRTIPHFEYASEQGWWPSLLAIEVGIERKIAYWENLSAPAWPTMEEGEYLLAELRSHTRSIWTDVFLMRSSPLYFDHPPPPDYDWATDIEDGPPALMSLLAIRWPFADLECPG